MGSESPVIDREEIQSALCQITEIEAVRVVNDHDNLIQELHVLASGQKAPRQIVRDIESLLMARFGIAVDHKKISIAQINSGPIAAAASTPPKAPAGGRLKIGNVAFDVKDYEAAAEVTLEQGDASSSGSAKGPASQSGRLRLAAMATLDAAARCIGSEANLALEHVSIMPTSSGDVAVACISVIKRTGEEIHAGSAMVKTTECDSVVKATLAAINRHLTQ
jgi:hypothetical protein